MDDSNLAVDFVELEDSSTELARKRADFEADLATLSARIDSMRAMWKGQGAVAFESMWDEWRRAADDLKLSLDDISRFLKTTSDSFREADEAVRRAAAG
jgi:WXG100 family type VII secretion target